jgi:hypothetical protein
MRAYGGMSWPVSARALVVANRTAATPRLLDEVRARAGRSPCSLTLLVPRPFWDPDTEEAATTLEFALPLLDQAAGAHVEGAIGDSDPFAAVKQEVEGGAFDEIIISTLPARVSRWLHRDLPRRVEALGLPVTVVTAERSERPAPDLARPYCWRCGPPRQPNWCARSTSLPRWRHGSGGRPVRDRAWPGASSASGADSEGQVGRESRPGPLRC